MIKITCANCQSSIEVNESTPVTLTCIPCGHRLVSFDKDVNMICVKCGRTNEVKAGVKTEAHHDSNHTVYILKTLKKPITKKAVEKIIKKTTEPKKVLSKRRKLKSKK